MRIVVLGATGIVGRVLLDLLSRKGVCPTQVIALASSDQEKNLSFGPESSVPVKGVETFTFHEGDLVFCAAQSEVAQYWIPHALAAGAVVVDKSAAFRMTATPLVVPEVNGHLLSGLSLATRGVVIANPNCVVIPLVMTLYPLHGYVPLKRVVVATYQSVSGMGHLGVDALKAQVHAWDDSARSTPDKNTLAFNVIPHIGSFTEDGSTQEENHIRQEVQKILDHPLPLAVTCVRVPVFVGHAFSVFVEFEAQISLEEIKEIFSSTVGIDLIAQKASICQATPRACAGTDRVRISRIRRDESVRHGLCFWVCCDNLRKGAALNAMQIAEVLVRNTLSDHSTLSLPWS